MPDNMDTRIDNFLEDLGTIQEFYGIYIVKITGKDIELFDIEHQEAQIQAKMVADNITIRDVL